MSYLAINHDNSGADFSTDNRSRYMLWRIWDRSLPRVCFIGLNPSTANATDDDPTIRSVVRIAKHNGYGGVVMMNCFPIISSDPNILYHTQGNTFENERYLKMVLSICKDVVFAWGSFDVVKRLGADYLVSRLFPDAKALKINKDGSPKHPLYCKTESKFVNFK